MTDGDLSLVVVVLTYRRADLLSTCLHAVTARLSERTDPGDQLTTRVLVVDNDPDQSARTFVEGFTPRVGYVCEPAPGIAAARNRALHECAADDLVAFIDDDEVPRGDWVTPLVETWRSTGAVAVAGRVVSVYDVPPDPWIVEGGFFERPRRVTGTRMPTFAAGNLLLDLGRLRESGLDFREPFGATGGEDSLLGRRLVQAGDEIVWCAESVVEDLVPAARLTRRWVLQRAYSQGNLQALIDTYVAGSPALRGFARSRRFVAGMAYIGRGSWRFVTGYATRSEATARKAGGLRVICRGLGMVFGVFGLPYEQYARQD